MGLHGSWLEAKFFDRTSSGRKVGAGVCSRARAAPKAYAARNNAKHNAKTTAANEMRKTAAIAACTAMKEKTLHGDMARRAHKAAQGVRNLIASGPDCFFHGFVGNYQHDGKPATGQHLLDIVQGEAMGYGGDRHVQLGEWREKGDFLTWCRYKDIAGDAVSVQIVYQGTNAQNADILEKKFHEARHRSPCVPAFHPRHGARHTRASRDYTASASPRARPLPQSLMDLPLHQRLWTHAGCGTCAISKLYGKKVDCTMPYPHYMAVLTCSRSLASLGMTRKPRK